MFNKKPPMITLELYMATHQQPIVVDVLSYESDRESGRYTKFKWKSHPNGRYNLDSIDIRNLVAIVEVR